MACTGEEKNDGGPSTGGAGGSSTGNSGGTSSGGAASGGASSGGAASGGVTAAGGQSSGGSMSAGGTAGADAGTGGVGAEDDGGADGAVGNGATVVDTCAADGDNDTADQAVTLAGAMAFCLPEGDVDVFQLVAPAGDRPQRAHIEVDQAAAARVRLTITAASDDSELDVVTFTKGTKETLDVLVGPGTTTYLSAAPYLGEGDTAFTLTWTPEADEHEPNDERAEAATVTKNTDVAAQLWPRYIAANDVVADDWYAVDLATSPTTVTFTAVPENVRLRATVFDPDGVQVGGNRTAPNAGALYSFQFTPTKAGVYRIGVIEYLSRDFEPVIRSGAPKSFTEQYRFRIEQ